MMRPCTLARLGLVLVATACVPWATNPEPPPPAPGVASALSVTVPYLGADIVLHAIPTGTVAVKDCHRANCLADDAGYRERFFAIMEDEAFSEPMPIWTFIIEHPEGRFAVDTGETPAFYERDAWRCDRRAGMLSRNILVIDVAQETTLEAQLQARDLDPQSFAAVLLTHGHSDHIGGVAAFEGVPIWTTRGDYEEGARFGVIPCRTFEGANVRFLDDAIAAIPAADAADSAEDAALGRGVDLTSDGALRAWVTAGHTPGSATFRLRTDRGDVWFLGDLTFEAEDLGGAMAGIHHDFAVVRDVAEGLRALAGDDTLWLPAHDWSVGERLTAWAQ